MFKTTAKQKRLCKDQEFWECFEANAIAQAPRGTKDDATNWTPSKIMPDTFTFESIVANQDKQNVMAAQSCKPRATGVRNAPVWVLRK